MHGTVDQGLSRAPARSRRSSVAFECADVRDDADLRRLLCQCPIDGSVQIALECEPSYMDAQAVLSDRHTTIVAREPNSGQAVAMGSRSVRCAYLNGQPVRLGYLSHLRIDSSWRRQPSVVRNGYQMLALDRLDDEAPFDITSIVDRNSRARRLLESGLPGLPAYVEYDRFFTLAIPAGARMRRSRCAHRFRIEAGSARRLVAIVACLQRNLRRYQFAPHWTVADMLSSNRCRGLRPEDFRLALCGDHVVGCAAVWDQRAFKQTVIRRYSTRLRRWRPAINLAAALLGRPRLPEVGQTVAAAFVSHLAVDAEVESDVTLALIEAARSAARDRGIPLLFAGFGGRHPALPAVRRRFRHHSTQTIVYQVKWPRTADPDFTLDGRPAQPEVATL